VEMEVREEGRFFQTKAEDLFIYLVKEPKNPCMQSSRTMAVDTFLWMQGHAHCCPLRSHPLPTFVVTGPVLLTDIFPTGNRTGSSGPMAHGGMETPLWKLPEECSGLGSPQGAFHASVKKKK